MLTLLMAHPHLLEHLVDLEGFHQESLAPLTEAGMHLARQALTVLVP